MLLAFGVSLIAAGLAAPHLVAALDEATGAAPAPPAPGIDSAVAGVLAPAAPPSLRASALVSALVASGGVRDEVAREVVRVPPRFCAVHAADAVALTIAEVEPAAPPLVLSELLAAPALLATLNRSALMCGLPSAAPKAVPKHGTAAAEGAPLAGRPPTPTAMAHSRLGGRAARLGAIRQRAAPPTPARAPRPTSARLVPLARGLAWDYENAALPKAPAPVTRLALSAPAARAGLGARLRAVARVAKAAARAASAPFRGLGGALRLTDELRAPLALGALLAALAQLAEVAAVPSVVGSAVLMTWLAKHVKRASAARDAREAAGAGRGAVEPTPAAAAEA